MNGEIGMQGLTALSAESLRWETPLATLVTRRENNSTSSGDEKNIVLPPVLDLPRENKDA